MTRKQPLLFSPLSFFFYPHLEKEKFSNQMGIWLENVSFLLFLSRWLEIVDPMPIRRLVYTPPATKDADLELWHQISYLARLVDI